MTTALEAPSTLALDAPEPVKPVVQDEAEQMVQLDTSKIPDLDKKVDEFVSSVLTSTVSSDEFREKVASIHNLGSDEIRAAAAVSNRMLDRPAKAMKNGLVDNSPIAKSLVDLRATIEELDPGKQDLFEPRKLWGIIPWGNKLRDYFREYQSSQTHINAIVESLYSGKDELLKDNAAIEQEKVNLWNLMQSLRQYIYVGKKIDGQLETKVAALETSDPEKARVVKEEMLFYVRQKNTDFLTQLAVSIQGYLALDMIRKNNLELVKGVDRATTTTVSALRTAVMVAQALTNQKLVLDQITALNKTTSSMIESTSKMMKKQTADIHEQAASSTIEIDKLKNAFNNIYETMDTISEFKVQALDNMKETVNVLTQEVERSQEYLDRARAETVDEVAKTIDVSTDDVIKAGEVKI